MMVKFNFFCFVFFSVFSFAQSTYYLDATTGDDTNIGDTPANAWKSLNKISQTNLGPGDQVLFKSDEQFNGHFIVNGSGSLSHPIIISSYGNGAKPILTGEVGSSGGGDYREAVYVNNNDNIIFDGLEIQNERLHSRTGIDDKDSYGIHIHNTGNQIMRNFTFRNMIFQNVYAVEPILEPENFNGLEVAGLRFFSSWNSEDHPKNIQDVLVENCCFTDLQRFGVHVKHGGGHGNNDISRNKNFVFRNNHFFRTGGTCILPSRTYNCLIENNIFEYPGDDSDPRMPNRGSSVWTWRSINTVIQYNQCLHVRGYLDSHGIHIDHENENTFVQYNYMQDCEGGFVEILGGNVNAVYRFNVSVNDGWRENPGWVNSNHTIWINENTPGGNIHYSNENYIYNNTIVMNYDYSTAIDVVATKTYIFNNIFYATNGAFLGGKQMVMNTNGTALFMRNNLFFGNVRNSFENLDTHPVFGNPNFNNENSGDKLGYQLLNNSAAVNAGIAYQGPPIPGAGTGIFNHVPSYPVVDFYGNPIDFDFGTPNIGACNSKNGEILGHSDQTLISDSLVLYPNPSSNKIFITNLMPSTRIKIYNTTGELVMDKYYDNGLEISKLSKGIYFILLEGYESQLFIKN
jgi:hypothetical protein